jgi:hypothetical protein
MRHQYVNHKIMELFINLSQRTKKINLKIYHINKYELKF